MKKILVPAILVLALNGCSGDDEKKSQPYLATSPYYGGSPLPMRYQAMGQLGQELYNGAPFGVYDCFALGMFGYEVSYAMAHQRYVSGHNAALEFQSKIQEMARRHFQAVSRLTGGDNFNQCPINMGHQGYQMWREAYTQWSSIQGQLQYGMQSGYFVLDPQSQDTRAEASELHRIFSQLMNQAVQLSRSYSPYASGHTPTQEFGNFLFQLGHATVRAETAAASLEARVGSQHRAIQVVRSGLASLRSNQKRGPQDLHQLVRDLDMLSRSFADLSRY